MNHQPQNIITTSAITKIFTEDGFHVPVLNGIDLQVQQGEMLAIVGPSGSGKSTLLHVVGGLDTPTSGTVIIDGVNIHKLSEKDKNQMRNQKLGFIYQFHHLLPEFTALENVAIPLLISNIEIKSASAQAHEILTTVGLAKRCHHRLSELSGGERQRVAVARALVTKPKCILADEPTGNLDHKTAHQIYDLIFTLKHNLQTAFIIVTHDLTITQKMDRVLTLEDGRLIC